MDQATRNSLQNATQQARRLLEREITEQLEGTFDVLPNGTIADKPGKHLDASQRLVRTKIVESIRHRAGGSAKADMLADAVADYVREAAFTILNRYIALKMLEVRGLVQQCITKGDQSSGFKEFGLAATGLAQLPDKGYRLYLESLFDELSTEVKILFDRHSDASLLWPRRQAFDGLLEILNADDLGSVWNEDETIGWVYQYFNSQEERRAMRDASQAPRNSRELAVRNQFFTPRYVVEFLTDNTLGRTWYEMRQGVTALAEKCRYLVRRPDEVFLSSATVAGDNDLEGPSLFAKFLADPSSGSLLPFSESQPQPMIELAHCVDAYARHPFGQEVEGQWWPWHTKVQMAAAESFKAFTTQDILDVMFCQCRADRHGGGDGIADSLFARLANEVRQRVLDTREPDQSHEELLRQPVFVAHRPKKDPRDLKILDPACGSSHFLIYCFDLLVTIYEEAWHDESSPASLETGHSLRQDFATIDSLHAAVPGLILRNNVHGIDIDPRCAQIGAFALWMRAQRTYNEFNIPKEKRPPIRKSNIVVAEPMPGEDDLLKEFLRSLREDRLESIIRGALNVPPGNTVRATAAMADSLCELVRVIWDSMKLASEAGSLLRIDRELEAAISKGRSQWEEAPLFRITQQGSDGAEKSSLVRELPGDGADFWSKAETLVVYALRRFASSAAMTTGDSFRRGLFAEDASRGLAFIDVSRQHFDTVLMNPPFGNYTPRGKTYAGVRYPFAKEDIDAAFVARGAEWLTGSGRVGVIANRTQCFKPTLRAWRQHYLLGQWQLSIACDLGYGVLDAALVEACAYTVNAGRSDAAVFVRALRTEAKADLLSTVPTDVRQGTLPQDVFVVPLKVFSSIPEQRISYWVAPELLRLFRECPPLEGNVGSAKQGLSTADDFRFLRLAWEVEPTWQGRGADPRDVDRWVPIAKGGEYCPYFQDLHLAIDWMHDGELILSFPGSAVRNPSYYRRAGVTYSERTASNLSSRVLPPGCVFTQVGPGVFPFESDWILPLVGFFMTRVASSLIELLVESGDAVRSGSAARHYTQNVVGSIPVPAFAPHQLAALSERVTLIWRIQAERDSYDVTSRLHCGPVLAIVASEGGPMVTVADLVAQAYRREEDHVAEILQASKDIETVVQTAFALPDSAIEAIAAEVGMHPWDYPRQPASVPDADAFAKWIAQSTDQTVDELVQSGRVSRAVTKMSYYASRLIELMAHGLECHPSSCIEMRRALGSVPRDFAEHVCRQLLLSAVGSALENRPILISTHRSVLKENEPLASATRVPPAHEQSWQGTTRTLPALPDEIGHSHDIGEAIQVAVEQAIGFRGADECSQMIGYSDLREWLQKAAFDAVTTAYSASRRQAPIYWQLSVSGCRYSIWLSWNAIGRDSLFRVANDLVAPRVQLQERVLGRLRSDGGGSPTPRQRDEQGDAEELLEQLRAFHEEMLLVASFWVPQVHDGVLINCAPLWKLMPQQKAWQKQCRACWAALCDGDYDWSYTAMRLWPERVVPKCVNDLSLAITHGLESVFWERDAKDKWVQRVPPATGADAGWKATIDRLVGERTVRQVKDALARFISAPAPEEGGKRGRRGRVPSEQGAVGNSARGTKRNGRPAKARNESEELF